MKEPESSVRLAWTQCVRLSAIVAVAALSGCASGRRAGFDAEAAQSMLAQADAARRSGDDEQALRLLERVIADNPTMVDAHMGVAEIHREQGDFAQAEIAYARAAEIEPQNFDAQYGRGLMLHLLDRLSDAVRAYLRALAIRPDDFDSNLNIATAYLQLSEPGFALPFAQRAANLRPDDGPARVNLGAIFAALNRYDEAVSAYQSAAERMEPSPPLLLNLADALGKADRHREMRNTLERLLAIEPSAQGWERMGAALFHLGRYDDALDAFRNALEFDARHYPALNGVGVCLLNRYISSGRRDREARRAAVEALRQSLRVQPGQARVLDLLSRFG